MRLEKLLFKDLCHLLTTKGSVSSEPNNTKPDPPFLPVKVFVIIPNNISPLGDVSNVIVCHVDASFNDPVQWIILCELT